MWTMPKRSKAVMVVEEPEEPVDQLTAFERQTKLDFGEDPILQTPDFVKIEKNLASLGFFTPSSKRIKSAKAKSITFTKNINGQRVEARALIIPGAIYGLPVTADQDKYLALQKIITDIQQRKGKVTNPISFTTAELLRLLQKQRDSGKNYKEIDEWLDLMSATTIISEGVVYLAGKRMWAKDRFRVFDRAVSFGKEVEPGKIADRNYVWLSEWQLENINNNYLMPVDFETYRKLRNHISKALVPLLQIWLYATRDEGVFEKRYDELCQILNIRQYQYLSKIKEILSGSLDELKAHQYLSDWRIEKTSDGKHYKVLFFHGDKFRRDYQKRLNQRETMLAQQARQLLQPSAVPALPERTPREQFILDEMVRRGITAARAEELLNSAPDPERILDTLEWGDYLVHRVAGTKIYYPAGFYAYLVREHVLPPETFVSTRVKQLREDAEEMHDTETQERLELEAAYEAYRREQIELHIRETYTPAEYQRWMEKKTKELQKQYKSASFWTAENLSEITAAACRAEVAPQVELLTMEEFAGQQKRLHFK